MPVAQWNNVFIFPAAGLGVIRALGELSPAASDLRASLLPPVDELRTTARHVATAAVHDGVAPAAGEDELRARVAECQWTPEYS